MENNIIYANGFQLSISTFEALLIFKVDSPVFDENHNIIDTVRENVADIRISPALAKVITGILAENIRQYEEQYGEINLQSYSNQNSEK